MNRVSRRTVLASLMAATVGVSARAATRPLEVFPIRTPDPGDEDFSDLQPLAAAFGTASVVQLGEPSHGAGTAFAAKARLVEFLHRHLGFDVLIWESGLYDVALAQAGLRGGGDALTAARRGIFSLWTEAAEARPVFEYVASTQATLRPIEMAGFDLQVTADGSVERHAGDLREFAARLRSQAPREAAVRSAAEATDARRRLFATRFSSREDLDLLVAAVRRLRELIHSARVAFETAWSPMYVAFMDRTLENLRLDAEQRFEAAMSPESTAERENRRDARNADNLRWLLETRYAGRKAIVWAHNVHVMKAYYSGDFRDVHIHAAPRDMKPTGVFIADWLRDSVYTIGVTAYQGSEGLAIGGPVKVIQPAPAGSLEAELHALGHRHAFVDLRASHAPRIARMPKFESVPVADPGRVYDGLLFIDRMAPATRIDDR